MHSSHMAMRIRTLSSLRVVFIVRNEGQRLVWLKICKHDELERNNEVNISGHPDGRKTEQATQRIEHTIEYAYRRDWI